MISASTVIRRSRLGFAACAALAALPAGARSQTAGSSQDIQRVINAAYEKYKGLEEGKNADYIPALAKVNPNTFGIALVTRDGKMYTAGDVDAEVSIQSISKVFTLARVLEDSGESAVRIRIGVDATGQAFNSILPVEQHEGREGNSFVNPGAIATTAMIAGSSSDEIWNKIIGTYNAFAGRSLSVNQEVYKSESETNQRNRAIADLMFAYGVIQKDPQRATDLYTRQCSVNVNVKDLATMAATLANGGTNPVTHERAISSQHIAPLLAEMATAGLYDESGKWLFQTGLPGKSGVGGGLIAVAPGKFGIAVISPPLDSAGNSVRGQKAIADISNALGGNPYAIRVSSRNQ